MRDLSHRDEIFHDFSVDFHDFSVDFHDFPRLTVLAAALVSQTSRATS